MKIFSIRNLKDQEYVLTVERVAWNNSRANKTTDNTLKTAGFTPEIFGFKVIKKVRSLNINTRIKKLYIRVQK